MYKYFYPLFALAFCSCCGTKQLPARQAAEQTVEMPVQHVRFVVSFISIGTGTDAAAREQLDRHITRFEQKNRTKLHYEKYAWGREGELDYCFRMNGLNPEIQQLFIAETKKILKGSSLVQYKENMPCRN